MIERGAPRSSAEVDEYHFRRPLRAKELLPAVAIGLAVGLAAFYVAALFEQRTPLRPGRHRPGAPPDDGFWEAGG
jgi:hypothetical protein